MASPTPRPAESLLARHEKRIAFVGIALGLVFAWANRFVQDDAFISFHYARSLVEGDGLTWFGERVEGYTNFLWVLWIAAAASLGADPVDAAIAGGLASFVVTLLFLRRTAARVLRTPEARLFALTLLVTNFTFVSYATGGLETMFLSAWVALALHATQRLADDEGPTAPARLAATSLLYAAMLLTRLDAAPVAGALGLVALAALRRRGELRAAPLAALVLPATAVLAAWSLWRLAYYGELLPNTYYAKLAGGEGLVAGGLRYLERFLLWYGVGPALVAGALLGLLGARARGWRRLLPSAAVVLASWGTVVSCGGDFMEFRLLVPSLPALALLLAFLWADHPLCDGLPHARLVASLGLALLVLCSAFHALRFVGTTSDLALDSVHDLRTFYGVYPDEDWGRIGRALAREIGDLDPTIALTAVGAIPYYGRIRTVDIHGLNDREIARRAPFVGDRFPRPGHQRYATVEHLRSRGVHWIIGHPTLVRPSRLRDPSRTGELSDWVHRTFPFEDLAQERPTLVALPISPDESLLTWYLTPTRALDRRIRERGWPLVRVEMGAR